MALAQSIRLGWFESFSPVHFALEARGVIAELFLHGLQFCLRLHHFGHVRADALEDFLIFLLRWNDAHLHVERNPLALGMAKAADATNGRAFGTQRGD